VHGPGRVTDKLVPSLKRRFNQEAGVVKNIFGIYRSRRTDRGPTGFTQEWPCACTRISSPTPAVRRFRSGSGIGDVFLHYRFQALDETARRPAFSPRVSHDPPTARRVVALATAVPAGK
jgi:proline racemase